MHLFHFLSNVLLSSKTGIGDLSARSTLADALTLTGCCHASEGERLWLTGGTAARPLSFGRSFLEVAVSAVIIRSTFAVPQFGNLALAAS